MITNKYFANSTTDANVPGPLFGGFCLQAFRRAGPPRWLDCFAPMGNERNVSSPRTQRHIASLGIEPWFAAFYHLLDA